MMMMKMMMQILEVSELEHTWKMSNALQKGDNRLNKKSTSTSRSSSSSNSSSNSIISSTTSNSVHIVYIFYIKLHHCE